jgi:hypothetical protein
MKQKINLILLLSLLILAGTFNSLAQNAPQWKVGDKVEVKNMSGEWVRATVLEVVDWRNYGRGFAYRIETEDKNAPNTLWNAPADSVRAREDRKKEDNLPADIAAAQPQNLNGEFKLGDLVDTLYDPGHGHNRGTIIETGDRKYKVHYTGCEKAFDEWVDASLVRPPATISADAPEIKFLFGKWRLTTVAIGGNNVVWGSSPGIQINADGSYIWYENSTDKPTKGKWRTDAKVPKLNEGTQKFDGLIVRDSEGHEWKAFRWRPTGETKDLIEIDRMCSGLSEVGSRF